MIRQTVVLSGKGGAGKTSITAALIQLFPEIVAVDADVNASNLPILLKPTKLEEKDFFGMDVARIDTKACTQCGSCAEICAFDAIDASTQADFKVTDGCEGCAACAWICPGAAINMVPHLAGKTYLSHIDNGHLIHADLIPGEDNSGKMIAAIRAEARELATEQKIQQIVIDGPPGTSCQAISSLTGTQQVLVVLEESLSGLSDYRRLAQLVERFRLPHRVIINKSGSNQQLSRQIEASVSEFSGEIIARIPFDPKIPQALSQRLTLHEMPEYRPIIEDVYRRILS